jgi:Tfp pilus assembly protein PilN
LLAATALLGLAMLIRTPYQTRAYAASLESEIHRLDPEVKNVLVQQTELKALQEKNSVLRSYAESRDLNLEALRELARLLPPDCWLMNYSYQDETIVLSGVAKSASEIQKILASSPLFKEVQSTSAITLDPTGREHFGIRMKAEAAR